MQPESKQVPIFISGKANFKPKLEEMTISSY
jgi:hypothetical protein